MKLLLVLPFFIRKHINHLNNKINPFCRTICLLFSHYITFSENACFILNNYLRFFSTVLEHRLIDDDLLPRLQYDFERHTPDFLPNPLAENSIFPLKLRNFHTIVTEVLRKFSIYEHLGKSAECASKQIKKAGAEAPAFVFDVNRRS